MEKHLTGTNTQLQEDGIQKWFTEMVTSLCLDKELYQIDMLQEEKTQMYKAFAEGNSEFIHSHTRQASSAHFISLIIDSFFKELLSKSNTIPNQLALDLSHSNILIWAEIMDNDESLEDTLILTQAKINAKYAKYGFNISSTIVEEEDNIVVPSHYQKVKIVKN